MARAFQGLSLGTMLLLVGAAALGYAVRGHDGETRHVVLSILAALATCLVHVVTLTYFTATGKMIRQAVLIGGLDMAFSDRVSALKKAVTKPMGLGVSSVVVAVAVGGFMAHQRVLHWLHAAAALASIYANGWAFLRQHKLILQNGALMEQAMSLYNQRKGEWKGGGGPIQNSEFKIQKAVEPPAESQPVRPAQDSLQA